jgi:hypothetical protein
MLLPASKAIAVRTLYRWDNNGRRLIKVSSGGNIRGISGGNIRREIRGNTLRGIQ